MGTRKTPLTELNKPKPTRRMPKSEPVSWEEELQIWIRGRRLLKKNWLLLRIGWIRPTKNWLLPKRKLLMLNKKSLRTTRRSVRWKKNWILLKKNCPCLSKNWKMLKRLPMNPNEAERSSNPGLPRTKNDFKLKKLNFEKPRLLPKKLTENTKKSPENWSWSNPIWKKPKLELKSPKRWSVNSKRPLMNWKTNFTRPSSEPSLSKTKWTLPSTKLLPDKCTAAMVTASP